jgi:diguanylate cyclase (GGDEF)-like protein/PAS domain S-box-containing protein
MTGLLPLIHRRFPGLTGTGVVDGLMVTIGLGTLVWVFALDRGLRASAGLLGESSLLIVLIIVVRVANIARAARRGRDRADALAAVGAAFVAATSRPAIHSATIVAAVELAGPEYLVVLWELGDDDDECRLVASSAPWNHPGFGLLDFDAPVRVELLAGRAVDTHLGLLIPLVAHDALIGLIGIEGTRIAAPVRIMLETLAYQVALALESAALTENLLRRESEDRLGSLVRNSSELVLVVDPDTTITYVSPAVERVLGRTAEDVTGQRLSDMMMPSSVTPLMRAMVGAPRYADGPPQLTGLLLSRGDGTGLDVEALVTDLTGDASVRGYVINVRDVSERKLFEDQLSHQAFHDAVTGLPNRALFGTRTVHALDRRNRSSSPVTVLFLDLDDFKHVNDSLGHIAGDRLLAAVGARLTSTIRAADTVARVGGDEFAILLEAAPDSDAIATASRIHEILEPPFVFEGKEVFAHASIGIAFADAGAHGADEAEQLLRNADVAMYIAKQHGKAQWRIFEPAMHQSVYDRLQLKRDLELAIERDELHLHYQPIVFLASGAISGYEALLRWNHPTRGPISPAEFIPIAEETGLIVPIGRRVLDVACRDAVRLNAVISPGDVRVGVNLSGRQLQRPEMVDEVQDALARSGLAPALLVLELTESVMMKDVDLSTRRLGELKALGVRLALDDFGTGYSSLNYIQRFPVDILKIDKSFTDVVGDERSALLTGAILGLGHALELRQIAEGIEHVDQAMRLSELGCPFGQGFLFGAAVPIEVALLQLAADGRMRAARAA